MINITPLEVDSFEIPLETLAEADWSRSNWRMEEARIALVETVIKNLDPESKKRYEAYQKQNDPKEGE